MFSAPSPDKTTVNEDAYAAIPAGDDSLVLAVADGVGGQDRGEIAARMAIESLINEIRIGCDLPLRTAIINGFERGQAQIIAEAPGAATTLVVVEIANQTVRTYNVGDSGACVIGGRGKNKVQTVFHSPTGYAVAAGLLTESEALVHSSRHLVSNILGHAHMSVEIGTPVALAPQDTVVVASDGLYDNLLSGEIAALACRGMLEATCCSLIDTATARMVNPTTGQPSKPDDLTVLLYRRKLP